MSFHHDPSGYSGPRLGLGHDSGWSHLASQGEGASSMGLDFDQIANAAVDEVFGRRGPVARAIARHPVRAFRATHPRIAARRDQIRAGWGSPGWSAESYYPEQGYFPEEGDDLTEEEEAFLEEDDGEEYGEEVVASEEAYGRRGGGGGGRPRRPIRRAIRHQRQQRQKRRQRRQAGWGSSSSETLDASRTPLGFDEGMVEEEPYWPEDEYEEEGEYFGNEVRIAAPVQQTSTFRSALETGLGLGIGFMGVALGIQLIAQAVGGGRR